MTPAFQSREIEFIHNYFGPSNPEETNILHNIEFNIIDYNTTTNVEPEKMTLFNGCFTKEVIKNIGIELYYCNGTTTLNRGFTTIADYNSIGIYDAIKNTYTEKGNMTEITENSLGITELED